jgi:CBS-domain-containing membrane protein
MADLKNPLRDWRTAGVMIAGAAGAAVAVFIMHELAPRTGLPLVAIPFGTSIVLVLGSPDLEPAQPRALIGGHLIATIVGLAVLKVTGPGQWEAALAVGLAIVAMQVTRTFHPPAGIDPLIVVTTNMPWTFLFVPVAAGAAMLAVFALVWHRVVRRTAWPARWW